MAIGIASDAGTSFYLSRIAGYRRAAEWLLTNRTLGAAEALEWGVVNRVYPEAEFEDGVPEVAAQFAAAFTYLQALVKTRSRLLVKDRHAPQRTETNGTGT
jgi:2-(1,2-epoxy-1,2-dihydrophenyl)acetyl-CoA isomerase